MEKPIFVVNMSSYSAGKKGRQGFRKGVHDGTISSSLCCRLWNGKLTKKFTTIAELEKMWMITVGHFPFWL